MGGTAGYAVIQKYRAMSGEEVEGLRFGNLGILWFCSGCLGTGHDENVCTSETLVDGAFLPKTALWCLNTSRGYDPDRPWTQRNLL